jgi:hypothetical protein
MFGDGPGFGGDLRNLRLLWGVKWTSIDLGYEKKRRRERE